MPRYATIIIDDDGREVVSAIGEFEGACREPGFGRAEAVAAGVRVGMVRGGSVDASGGFGFPARGPDAGAAAGMLAMLKRLPHARPARTAREAASAGSVRGGSGKKDGKPARGKAGRAKRGRKAGSGKVGSGKAEMGKAASGKAAMGHAGAGAAAGEGGHG